MRSKRKDQKTTMTTYTIDNDNNIIAHATPEQAQDTLALGTQLFTNQKEFGKITADWPASRLVETWNGFAGTAGFDDLRPVKKFENRAKATRRIWDAVQRIAPAAGPVAQDAQVDAAASKRASRKKSAPKATKGANKPAAKDEARAGSKKQIVLDLLCRKNGATLAEIAKATDWQNHSIRGFISGQLAKKMGLTVESTKNEPGERTYRLTK